jgi:hypothetical protein
MRAVISLGLLLALSTVPTASYAGMRTGSGHGARIHIRHVQHHRVHHFQTMRGTRFVGNGFNRFNGFSGFGGFGGFGDGFYDSDAARYAAPYVENAAPEAVAIPAAPPQPRRLGDDRPTVEHTDVGVTIIRGPHLGS